MKNSYWARIFRKPAGGYLADVPDLPGCSTDGESVERVYLRLINEAIPLWLEDQPWPPARTADEILAAPRGGSGPVHLLIRVSPEEVGGPAMSSWSALAGDLEIARRRVARH